MFNGNEVHSYFCIISQLTDWKYILFYKMKRLLVPYFVACFFV